MSVQQALDVIRQQGVGEKIVYLYAVDEKDRLTGVLPTRRLLTAQPQQRLADIMISRVVAVPDTATVLEACEAFVLHKFLAFPVVNHERKVVGIVDVGLLRDEVFELAEGKRLDDVFEAIGFHISQVRDASPFRAFRFRFPWLLATIGSGTVCAILASAFQVSLAKSLVLAFFLTMVLGLGESVSIQSMTVTVQALHAMDPTFSWYARAVRREVGTAALLGCACGIIVGGIVWLWHGAGLAAFSIGASILLTLCAACFFGLSVPAFLHAMRLDPRIAAGPVTFALTDLFTPLFYPFLAACLL